jgi:hypothetical protein
MPRVTEHLKQYQFKPGQSGNPGGRPKGYVPVAHSMRKALSLTFGELVDLIDAGKSEDPEVRQRLLRLPASEVLAMIAVRNAMGDNATLRTLLERVDGRVTAQDQGPEDPVEVAARVRAEMARDDAAADEELAEDRDA